MDLSRRTLLQSSVALALLRSYVGCDDAPVALEALAPRTVARTLHVDLSRFAHVLDGSEERLVACVAGRHHPLKRHDTSSRTRLRADGRRARATHYAEAVAFSAEGAQSYVVGLPRADGPITPLVAAIHVPGEECGDGAGSGGGRALDPGLDAGAAPGPDDGSVPNDDPGTIADGGEAAIWAVFHNPRILTHDPALAAKVKCYIRAAKTYAVLAPYIDEIADAWITSVFVVDPQGNRVPATDAFGNPIPGKFVTEFVLGERVKPLVARLTAEALEAMQSDPALEGKKYFTLTGAAALTGDLPDAATSGDAGATDAGGATARAAGGTRVAARDQQGDDGGPAPLPYTFQVDQAGSRHRRSIDVWRTKNDASHYYCHVRNPNAVLTVVSTCYWDADGQSRSDYVPGPAVPPPSAGQPVPLKGPYGLLGILAGTYYPSISALFGPSQEQYNFKVPEWARSFEIRTTSLAVHPGDPLGTLDHPETGETGWSFERFRNDHAMAIMLSALIDFFVPVMLLGVGVAAGPGTGKDLLKVILGQETAALIVREGFDLDTLLLNAGRGATGDGILDNLGQMGKDLLRSCTNLMAKVAFAPIAGIIYKKIATKEAEEATASAIPIVGQILRAVEIAQEVAQLTVQFYDIANGGTNMRAVVTRAHKVTLVLRPPDGQHFPLNASWFEASITATNRQPLAWSGAFALPTGEQVVTIVAPSGVVVGGDITVLIRLYNGKGGDVVGTSMADGKELKTSNGVDEQTVPATIYPVPVPIFPTTKLVHLRKLVPTALGRSWVDTATTPANVALSCADTSLCAASGLTIDGLRVGCGFDSLDPVKKGQASHARVVDQLPSGDLHTSLMPVAPSAKVRVVLGGRTADGSKPLSVLIVDASDYARIYPFDGAGPLPDVTDPSKALAALRGKTVYSARIDVHGLLWAVTDLGVECIPATPTGALRPATSTILASFGSLPGRISKPVAVAPIQPSRGTGVLVLDGDGQNGPRLTAFDRGGNLLAPAYFKSSSSIDLGRAGISLYDVDIDHLDNTWILYGAGDQTFVEVFGKDGASVTRFPSVHARAIAVDPSSTLFSLNVEAAVGPNLYAEPTLSQWTPRNDRSSNRG